MRDTVFHERLQNQRRNFDIRNILLYFEYKADPLAESLLLFMLYFIPTPGASGAAEGGAVAVFGLFVPWSVAGVMAVTWRLLSEYTGIAIGTFIVVRMLGWGGADKVLSDENNKIEKGGCGE